MEQRTVTIPVGIYLGLVDRDSESLGLVGWETTKTTAKATGSLRKLAEFAEYLESLAGLMEEDQGESERVLYAWELGGYGSKKLRRVIDRFPTFEEAKEAADAERAAREAERAKLEAEPDDAEVQEAADSADANAGMREALLTSDGEGVSGAGSLTTSDLFKAKLAHPNDPENPQFDSRGLPLFSLTPLGRAVARELQKRHADSGTDDVDGTAEETAEVADDDGPSVSELADKYNLRNETWEPLVWHTGETLEGLPRELQTAMQNDGLAEWYLDIPSCRITPLGYAVIHEIRVRRGVARRAQDTGQDTEPETPDTANDMADAGSITSAEIERAWADIRRHYPEVPAVAVVIAGGADYRRNTVMWGRFHAEQWSTHSGVRHELMVSGESLGAGSERVLETLLHEAVHAVAHERGVKETSRQGKYHNKRFISLARELGLEWSEGEEPHKVRGFSAVVLTDDTRERFADTMASLSEGRRMWREIVIPEKAADDGDQAGEGGDDAGEDKPKRKKSPDAKPVAECSCETPRRIYTSKKTVGDGSVLCAHCREPFRLVED